MCIQTILAAHDVANYKPEIDLIKTKRMFWTQFGNLKFKEKVLKGLGFRVYGLGFMVWVLGFEFPFKMQNSLVKIKTLKTKNILITHFRSAFLDESPTLATRCRVPIKPK